MDYNYIKPFIDSAMKIIKEVTDTNARKISAYMTKAGQKQLNNGLYIDITGDVKGRIIFNLSNEMMNGFATKMIGMNIEGNESEELLKDPEFVQSAVGELGNLISGNAITTLENSHYNCNIYPPKPFSEDSNDIMNDDYVVAVIDFRTDLGDFDICIVNQDEKYSKNLSILLYNITNSIVYKTVYAFLPRGFYIYDAGSEEDIKEITSKTTIDFMIGDFDNTSYSKKKVLSYIRETEFLKDLVIASYTSKDDDYDFKRMMDSYDIHYFIEKQAKSSSLIEGIKELLKAYEVQPGERRKQIRVDIEPKEKMIINFKIEKEEIEPVRVPGLVIDISLGTVFFKSAKRFTPLLSLRQKLENITIMIHGKGKIHCNGLIFFRKGSTTGIKLMDMDFDDLKMLCEFIFERYNKDLQLRV
jgi:chemotaxis protein CheX